MSPSFGLWNRRSGRSPARALMRSTHPLRSHGLGPWNFGSTAALNTCSVGWYSVEIAAGHMRRRVAITSHAAPHDAKVRVTVEQGFRDKRSRISC